MEIELSEDLQHYKESFVLGLTLKQTFFSLLALGAGTTIVLFLYEKIGVTFSCYVATPFVVPLALTGFYNYHGLTFRQFAGKMIYFTFFNRPLVYWSTESAEVLTELFEEERQREEKAGKEREHSKEARLERKMERENLKEEKKDRKMERKRVKKEKRKEMAALLKRILIRIVRTVVSLMIGGAITVAALAVWYRYYR
ncbi:MAG: PrgI family protein [Lachnospiraceae bacterium]|jgi:hypothetical protein|nr:PrgI family protein [Lachnospiraceae bacterium]